MKIKRNGVVNTGAPSVACFWAGAIISPKGYLSPRLKPPYCIDSAKFCCTKKGDDGRVDGRTDGQTDGRKDRQTDRATFVESYHSS